MTVQELYDKRAKAVAAWREFLDSHAEGLTPEQKEESDRREAEIDELGEQIKTREKLADAEAEEKRLLEARSPLEPQPRKAESRVDPEAQIAEFRDYLNSPSILKDQEIRAATDPQSVGTVADGGYTVPDEWMNELVAARTNSNIMRSLARVIQKGPGTLNIPKLSAHGVAAWYSEKAAIAVAKDTFGTATLSAFKAGRIIQATQELVDDSMFNIASYVMTELGRSIGVLEEEAFLVGDNSGEPNGVFTAATTGVTAASGTAVTTDELLNLKHSVGRPYRRDAAWLMADATVLLIRKLKDGNQQYLWQPGLQAGEPDRLVGNPVHTSEYAPAATTGLDAILYGWLGGYWIADRQGLRLQRLNELYAVNGLIGFLGTTRTDGELLDTSAVRVLTMG